MTCTAIDTHDDDWFWWASRDEEHYNGPFSSRAEAVAALYGAAGYICEARQDQLRLADYIDAESVFDQAEDSACDLSNEDGYPIFVATPEQVFDLETRLKRACDEWQEAHGLRFIPWAFSATRNKERVDGQ